MKVKPLSTSFMASTWQTMGIVDTPQQMTNLEAFVQPTVTMLHQICGNGLLFDVGFSVLGPVPVFLLVAIGQVCKAPSS